MSDTLAHTELVTLVVRLHELNGCSTTRIRGAKGGPPVLRFDEAGPSEARPVARPVAADQAMEVDELEGDESRERSGGSGWSE